MSTVTIIFANPPAPGWSMREELAKIPSITSEEGRRMAARLEREISRRANRAGKSDMAMGAFIDDTGKPYSPIVAFAGSTQWSQRHEWAADIQRMRDYLRRSWVTSAALLQEACQHSRKGAI